MSIRFQTADGRQGTLDVAKLAADELGGVVTGVQDGIVQVKTEDGSVHGFSLGQWAEENQARIVSMDGFNGPDSALDLPPNGMNYIDQSAFYHDGMDMNALSELYPKAIKRNDGRVVVLDNDGLWKTMWSPYLVQPLPAPSFPEQVAMNLAQDPRLSIRTAGVVFLFALAGKEAKQGKKGFEIKDVVDVLKTLRNNAPYENRFQIGKLLNQTTGIDPWKLSNAILAPQEWAEWSKFALKVNTFQYRMKQMDMAKLLVNGMRSMSQDTFLEQMKPLAKLDECDKLIINLKEIMGEFIQFLVGLDLMRDISKTTGLNEWISINESGEALDPTKLPAMPEFVKNITELLRWIMPIVQEPKLSFARGKSGFKAVTNLMAMIDECIYSLAGVPDSSAKYKMFMALKRLQTQIESKLSFTFHPDPMKNLDGLKENPFMQAKSVYGPTREAVYQICQLPPESWMNSILDSLRSRENLEVYYDTLPKVYADLVKSFLAMDAAYDMQTWLDVGHAERTNDAFANTNESFGGTPPEAGYLAKNSPRAVFNISETLVEAAALLSDTPDDQLKAMLRSPYLLATVLKSVMVASVNREVGTVEVLSKFGVYGDKDPMASPDSKRIWEDPDVVHRDIQAQVEELMGSIAMQQAQQAQAQQGEEDAAVQQQEEARDAGGMGPNGGPQPAMRARGA